MKKFRQLLVTGLVMLAGSLALQAGQLTLAWDYPFNLEPTVTSFKLYSLQGSNAVFTANNANAFRTNTVPKALAMVGSGTGTNGWTTNLSAVVTNLAPGWWTFTATAVSTNGGLESVNSTVAYDVMRPIAVWNLLVQP